MSTLNPTAGDAFAAPEPTTGVEPSPSSRTWLRGAPAGAGAALIASGVMLWAGRALDGVILAQLISERMTDIVPLSMFRRGLDALESDAKPLTLAGLTLLQVLIGGLVGAGYAYVARPGAASRLRGGAILSLAVWLGLSLVAAPLGGVGLFAHDVAGDVWRTQATFVFAAIAFAALSAAFIPWPAAEPVRDPEIVDRSRRRFAGGAALAALALPALASGVYVGRYVQHLRHKSPKVATIETPPDAPPADFAFSGMPPRITPADDFYVVSKNFVDPTVDGGDWTLEVSGLVERPMNLSYSDIITRPSSEFTSTLECISNSVGGKYMSTGTWQGFSLKALLEEAGLKDGVVDIELHAADGYVESIPLAEALSDDTMLVHTINGERLPDDHGYPLRLIVPGIFGMKNVKWITKIVPVDQDIQGYWQERGWSDIATVVTTSRVDVPRPGKTFPLGQPLRVGGIAFAGDRGISKVEVSFDFGKTWLEAQLDAVISPLAWRLWQFDYTPDKEGPLQISVRATDGRGDPQIASERETLPDGATGYHKVSVKIAAR